ncbi:SDR family NAD(P)-dependent oxidoreductase [Sphingomonas sp. SUN039]|uniref:SDR family NAD(P)-dependent oxidoreductase n=1 Tax=Sphingomonas sp. SUN039 TaxID=2937787 RepID=UPI002164B3F4|nr:SDR family NAD(P)-dependent oxidoreductase [Sphingomonas sp. SUN039]UVO55747.1 SDR family NAD(P)-dependent oxidoreductase [Sphingomonas sp. SUN039]
MAELRYDDRVAIVTGGGRGLGRAYALLLAARGAKVVVNDVGGNIRGDEVIENPAADVVAEIVAAGGEAVAVTDTVATVAGGKAIIDAAMDTWGRLDILIPNAGNVRRGEIDLISHEDFQSVIDVHMQGAWNLVRTGYEIMAKAGYGRVVLTSSIGGIYGNATSVNYAMAKAAMIGLNNVIGLEGADRNIKSNIILPGAVTRMSEGIDITQFPPMPPELVAAVVGWLAHESCSVTAEMYVSTAGRVARAYINETAGVFQPDWTPDQVGARIAEIRNPAGAWTLEPVPGGFGEHLGRSFEMATGG